ncbi:MAG: hypothetical protein PPHEINF_6120 [uncultured Paraburkholderia sp.]|nr:MAG: hypothetical protein PPHEINF_6120 [uncultured Paraburkholderia sp.]CAH2809217.1 MAG: hypothetical protein PPHEESC_6084 [uncultured Paraburkholderia sp.]CAH2944422.1 MAG: hypothetical protein PPHEMADMSA_6144 [uncultured Paraburkholderia sp.]CAH2944685.1 MAG: hypothetical protein PPHERAN_6116 [uncultured Paraburkholderia sp.]
MGQYGPTTGVIREIVCRHLHVDANMRHIEPEDIVVTISFQEAAVLCMATLFKSATYC